MSLPPCIRLVANCVPFFEPSKYSESDSDPEGIYSFAPIPLSIVLKSTFSPAIPDHILGVLPMRLRRSHWTGYSGFSEFVTWYVKYALTKSASLNITCILTSSAELYWLCPFLRPSYDIEWFLKLISTEDFRQYRHVRRFRIAISATQ